MEFKAQAVPQERFILNPLTPTRSEEQQVDEKGLASAISPATPAFIAFLDLLTRLKGPAVVDGY